jgi:hypothetical protein
MKIYVRFCVLTPSKLRAPLNFSVSIKVFVTTQQVGGSARIAVLCVDLHTLTCLNCMRDSGLHVSNAPTPRAHTAVCFTYNFLHCEL